MLFRSLEEMIREFPEREWEYRTFLAYGHLTLGLLQLKGLLPAPDKLLEDTRKNLSGQRPPQPARPDVEAVFAEFDKALAGLPPISPGGSPPAVDRAFVEEMLDTEDPAAFLARTSRYIRATVLESRIAAFLLLSEYTEVLQAIDQEVALLGRAEDVPAAKARGLFLKAAEMEQSHMPWSRPPRVDHAKATRMAEYLAAQEGVSPAAVYNAACAFSLASLDEAAGAAERRHRADRAMAYLSRIADTG